MNSRADETNMGRGAEPRLNEGADSRVAGRGQVCIWPGGMLWIGLGLQPGTVHSHHALQLSFGRDHPLRFRRGDEDQWTEYLACIIPADLPHAFDGGGRMSAVVFVDPETAEGKRLLVRATDGRITPLDPADGRAAADRIFAAHAASKECVHLVGAVREAVRRLAGIAGAHESGDARVLGAMELIRARLDERVTLTAIARDLNISPSRLRHLFVEEVGIPFRTYVLWRRLGRVIERIGTENLTHAALAAGFADAAHMTRTFRRMIGFAPSGLEITTSD